MTPAQTDDTAGLRQVGRYEWERVVRRVVMPGTVKFLAFVLSTYADADGSRVRPGIEALVLDTGQSKSTVKRALGVLRDDFRFLQQVSRGGGKNGRGKATEYRLAIPVDLLDRVDLIPIPPPRSGLTIVSPQEPVDNSQSGLTQMNSQANESGLTQMSHENDIQGSNQAHSESMRAQIGSLRAHLGELLPATTPTTKDDQHSGPDPTQLTTARTADENPIDLAAADEHPLPRPAKCRHGLAAHVRPEDGLPTCPLCRREDAEEPP